MMHPSRALAFGLLLGLAACSTPTQRLERMYADSVRERGSGPFTSLEEDFREHQEARRSKVRKLLAEEKLASAKDFLYAGAILASSPHEEDLLTAQMAGLKAAELGEDKGFRVAAEAIDRHAMHTGQPQRYGTQFYYEEVLQKWRLYPVAGETTDAERAAMGVAPLAELRAREETLNERVR